jgi:hypothetical protein
MNNEMIPGSDVTEVCFGSVCYVLECGERSLRAKEPS